MWQSRKAKRVHLDSLNMEQQLMQQGFCLTVLPCLHQHRRQLSVLQHIACKHRTCMFAYSGQVLADQAKPESGPLMFVVLASLECP